MATMKELHRKLCELNSPDEIAAVLEEAGIQGDINDGRWCPIAQYLRTGSDYVWFSTKLLVCNTWVTVCSDDDYWNQDFLYNNGPIELFISRFNKGQYPNLIEDVPFLTLEEN